MGYPVQTQSTGDEGGGTSAPDLAKSQADYDKRRKAELDDYAAEYEKRNGKVERGDAEQVQMSKGGEVPGYSLLEEHPSHFVVHDGDTKFRVAKAGLSPATLQRIQGFASGGEVQHFDVGGAVLEQPTSEQQAYYDAQPDSAINRRKWEDLAPALRAEAVEQEGESMRRPPQARYAIPTAEQDRATRNAAQLSALVARAAPPSAPAADDDAYRPPAPLTTKTEDAPPTVTPQAGRGGGSGGALDPAGLKEVDEAGQRQQAASAAEQEAIRKQDEESAYTQKLQNIHKADLLTQGARMAADAEREVSQTMGDLQKSVVEFGNTKIDPSRYWANATTGQKVLAGIGLALGGLGASATGGVNKSVEIINDAINKDIDAQKSNLETKGKQLGMKLGVLGKMQEIHKDAFWAHEATVEAYTKYANGLIDEMKTRTSDPIKIAQLQATQAGLDVARGEKRQALAQSVKAEANKNAIEREKIRAMAGKSTAGQVDTSAVDILARQRKQGTLTRPLEYGNDLDAAAAAIATEMSGGRLPNPSRVAQIRSMLPSHWANDARSQQALDNIKRVMRNAKTTAGRGVMDEGGEG